MLGFRIGFVRHKLHGCGVKLVHVHLFILPYRHLLEAAIVIVHTPAHEAIFSNFS
jgi:hypothetical protein